MLQFFCDLLVGQIFHESSFFIKADDAGRINKIKSQISGDQHRVEMFAAACDIICGSSSFQILADFFKFFS